MGKSPYEVLGLAPSATDDQIRAAYVALARQFHPDQHPDASPAERAIWDQAMTRVNEAYNTLKDPAAKADARRETASPPQRPA